MTHTKHIIDGDQMSLLIVIDVGKNIRETIAQHPIFLIDYMLSNYVQDTRYCIPFHANVVNFRANLFGRIQFYIKSREGEKKIIENFYSAMCLLDLPSKHSD